MADRAISFADARPGELFCFLHDLDVNNRHVKLNNREYVCDKGRGTLKHLIRSHSTLIFRFGELPAAEFEKVKATWL